MRPFSTYRQWHGETSTAARLDFAAGALRLAAGRPNELYRMDVLYDGERYEPVSDFDAARGNVTLGLRAAGNGGIRVVSKRQLGQTASVTFSPRSDLALAVALGAVDGDLGARGFAHQPRPGGGRQSSHGPILPAQRRLRRDAVLSSGAAELTVLGLGNGRCDRIAFEGGVGRVTLDFSGA
jgi:hypothetical protein